MKQDRSELAYICSPYRGDIKRNKEYARQITRIALMNGFIPITPHLYLTEVTDDSDIEERRLGMDAGLEILKQCGFIIIGEKYGISEGMSDEMHAALENNVRLLFAGKEKIFVISRKEEWEDEQQA